MDKQDRVFCFTRGEHPVIVFDRDGKFLRSWGEGVVRRAHGITIDADDMVWLTDDLHHTVRKFTPEGKLLLTIGDPDKPAELQGGKPFNRPTHVAICPKSGYLFVSDGYGNSRVHKYAPDGKYVMSWGEPGTDPGQFNLPHNLVTDRDGLVYVADRENHRVQIFDGKGQLPGPVEQPPPPLRALRGPRAERALLRGRARLRHAGHREDAEPRPAGQRARRQGPAGGALRRPVREREAGRVHRAPRRS